MSGFNRAPFLPDVSLGIVFEHIAEQAIFPSCVIGSVPKVAQVKGDTKPGAAPSNPLTRKRLGSPIEFPEPEFLPGLVDALLRDLPAFVSRVDVFNAMFAEVQFPLSDPCLH